MSEEGNASKREVAYERLRRILILQQVPEGVRLRESEWTKRLNVNRSALREAFARLEAEGLIETGDKTGYFVPVLVMEDMMEVVVVRIALEGAAIELICEAGLNTPGRAVFTITLAPNAGRAPRDARKSVPRCATSCRV